MRKKKIKPTKTFSSITQRDIYKIIQSLNEKDSKKRLDPRTLTQQEEDLVIEYLHTSEGLTKTEIAVLLDRHMATITKRIRVIDEHYRIRLMSSGGVDARDVFSELVRIKKIVQARARSLDKWELVLKAEIDTIDKGLELGIIQKYDPLGDPANIIDLEVLETHTQKAISSPVMNSDKSLDVSTSNVINEQAKKSKYNTKDLINHLESLRKEYNKHTQREMNKEKVKEFKKKRQTKNN
jgi:hypothetical protein